MTKRENHNNYDSESGIDARDKVATSEPASAKQNDNDEQSDKPAASDDSVLTVTKSDSEELTDVQAVSDKKSSGFKEDFLRRIREIKPTRWVRFGIVAVIFFAWVAGLAIGGSLHGLFFFLTFTLPAIFPSLGGKSRKALL